MDAYAKKIIGKNNVLLIIHAYFIPVMSVETTMDTMRRCVRLGACFLLKKPLSDDDVSNLWQHVNLKNLRREKIKELLQGWNYFLNN